MQSNTAETRNRPANFPNFSVEKRTYKPVPSCLCPVLRPDRMSPLGVSTKRLWYRQE